MVLAGPDSQDHPNVAVELSCGVNFAAIYSAAVTAGPSSRCCVGKTGRGFADVVYIMYGKYHMFKHRHM
jgi:hypothetical protein